eukprot:scaffold1993_cov69-Skeletonema_marinoi.AAC.1
MAKNAPPSGDAKKRPTSTAVPIVGKTALISSRGPFGPCGDGDERAFPIEMGALILHLWMPVAGRMTKACTAEANRLIRRNTANVLDVMVVL